LDMAREILVTLPPLLLHKGWGIRINKRRNQALATLDFP